ncbi:CD209 antigen-like protein E [Octodon degus]|uniref:CD209 antigen-like protein E n=1 Tax=Octodon degus TaxID=10160 RepID=A0A6P6DLJ6_OCTDE|nr:CD209 antigen-like protein E [Octodon degus]
MHISKEVREEHLGPLGCLDHSPILLLLQLLSLVLLTGLLVAILVPGPWAVRTQQQENIYEEIAQLQLKVGRLCRPCPWDWKFFRRNCYFFSKSKRTWNDSVTACEKAGAKLVIINSTEEQSFLQTSKTAAWMGLSDLKEAGKWQWMDGSPLHSSLRQYLKPGEPNKTKEENCVELTDDGWSNERCMLEKFWICKKHADNCPSK